MIFQAPHVSPQEIADALIPIIAVGGGLLATIVLGFPIVRVIARRFDRPPNTISPRDAEDTRLRLERIESAVEGIALEVERIAEAQRFTTKLLADRHAGALPSGER